MAISPNQEYIDQLVEEIETRGLAENTIKAYQTSVSDFFNHHEKRPDELGIQEIKKYQRHLLKEKNLAPNTVNRHMTAIKFFYLHVMNRYEIDQLLPRVKVPQSMPIVLSEQEVARMIDSVHSVFWKAVLLVMYSTGLRQGEVRNLKVTDIDSEPSRMLIYIRNAKGGRDRQAKLSPLTLAALRSYWRLYRLGNEVKSDWLFISSKKNKSVTKRLSHSAIGHIVQKAADLAGIKKKFTHIFFAIPLRPIF